MSTTIKPLATEEGQLAVATALNHVTEGVLHITENVTAAANSATSASNSATSASGSATTATNKASEASASATAASKAEIDAENFAVSDVTFTKETGSDHTTTYYSAKHYAGVAEGWAEDAEDTAEDIADHLAQSDENTTDIGIADKRISNIEKLLQGNLYDYQTDSTSAYTKSVPSGAMPYAGLEKVGGKTVVMNQLVQNGNFVDTSGWDSNNGTISASGNVLTYTVTTPSGDGLSIKGNVLGTILNHIYFITADLKYNDTLPNTNPSIGSGGYSMYNGTSVTALNTWTKVEGFFTRSSTSGDDKMAIYIRSGNCSVGDTIDIRNVWCTDLTSLCGAGNEPTTVEQFREQYPAQYYAHNEGSLLSAGVTEVVSAGKNILPTTVPSNYIRGQITSTTIAANNYRFTFGIPCKPYTNYYFSQTGMNTEWDSVAFGKKIPAVGDSVYGYHSMAYSTGYMGNSGDNTYILIQFSPLNGYSHFIESVKPMIEMGTSRTLYVPYKIPITTPISASIQALEGYGWSAGTAYNYVDFERKVFVKNVGRVDLGSLSWTYSANWGDSPRFESSFLNPLTKPIANDKKANIITARYVTYSRDGLYATSQNGIALTFGGGNNYAVTIRDSAYSDATTFKSALDGVYLYYELATPTEVDISEYLTDDNLIQVESGGTLTFPNQNGDDYQIPVPSEETYMIDLQSALGE